MPTRIRVVLADDHEPMRRAIRALLQSLPITITGEASNYIELLDGLGAWRPDVVIMDVHMPNAKSANPATVRVRLGGLCLLAMSFANDEETKHLARSYGAFRLLDKMELGSTLVPAIQECTRRPGKAKHASMKL
jgi:DNA-binding NarL/FixJ family response regulator